jgi:hypothetical protein
MNTTISADSRPQQHRAQLVIAGAAFRAALPPRLNRSLGALALVLALVMTARGDADWVSLGSGMNDVVYALALSGTSLYAGGTFTMAGGVTANHIAKWNGSAWSALGSGMLYPGRPACVSALAVSGANLYAGGKFATAGGVPAQQIAKWDGSAWSALGSGMSGEVEALAVGGINLYAGGTFTTAGGVPANAIAKWDGTAWSALGSGMNGDVSALAVSGINLYAGGGFAAAGGVPANHIAKWDGSAWSALGSGLNGRVCSLAVSGTNLYAGGEFTTAGGVPVNYIAKWDGSAWSALGSGMSYYVAALAVSGTDLYAGGNFTTAGGTRANCIAKWDDSAWSAMGSGTDGYVEALAADGARHLFVGGSFTVAGTNASLFIAQANVGSVSAPPVIVASPASLAVGVGATANFQVAATGSPRPVYQWVFNGTTAIAGATSSVLSLTNVQLTQAGTYSVTATNLYGAVTSAPAMLQVIPSGIVLTNSEAALRAAMAGGGTVTFACDGTIWLASTLTNDVNLTLDASGHQVTINGGGGRVFLVNSNVNLTLINLTIANGWSQTGAGIYNAGGCLSVRNCVFVCNSATGPSGVEGRPGTNGCGGALFNAGAAAIANSIFSTNVAAGGAGCDGVSFGHSDGSAGGSGCGGAIYNIGSLSISNCSFVWNSARGGGGGAGADGEPEPFGAWRPGSGGAGGAGSGSAVWNLGLLAGSGCTFWSNSAAGGQGNFGGSGGIQPGPAYRGGAGGSGGDASALFNGGSASLMNSTFALNSAVGATGGNGGMGSMPATIHYTAGYGGDGGMGGSGFGAICDTAGQVHLTNCTLAFNSGTGGSGGAGGPPGNSTRPPGTNGAPGIAVGGLMTSGGRLVNTVLATNTASNGFGAITDAGYNLSSDGSCAFTGIGSLNNIDPKLGPLSDNGGPTLTMALLPGSPAIDAGNTSVAPATDQRGFPRPAGLAADIGAFEYGSVMPAIAISRSGAENLNILGSGNANQWCRLLCSSNLSDWTPVATNQFGSDGTYLFHDDYPPGRACRFYRLVMP